MRRSQLMWPGVQALRPDQIELVDRHRRRVVDLLSAASAEYDGSRPLAEAPAGKALFAQPRELQVSVAVAAAAAMVERRRLQHEHAETTRRVATGAAEALFWSILETLRRRRLPFSPADVELVLDLGSSTLDPGRIFVRSYETLALGVAAAANLLSEQPGSPSVVAALERAGPALDALRLAPGGRPGLLRTRIRALLAANVPGGLLDLSAIQDGDGWAESARRTLRTHAERWDGVQDVLAHLTAARSSKPTKAWSGRARDLLERHEHAGRLGRELVELVLELDLVSTPASVRWPPSWLLATGNENVVRGAVWFTGVTREAWAAPLLGQVALRCAASSPDPRVTTALSGKVAWAAVETLVGLDDEAAEDALRLLAGEIRRRDLVKRIRTALGDDRAAPPSDG